MGPGVLYLIYNVTRCGLDGVFTYNEVAPRAGAVIAQVVQGRVGVCVPGVYCQQEYGLGFGIHAIMLRVG